jgi:hypothetical protein
VKANERSGQNGLREKGKDRAADRICAAFRVGAAPTAIGAVFLFVAASLFSHLLPFVFFFGWIVPLLLVPAIGLSARRMARLLEARSPGPSGVSTDRKEKELLEALERHGETTPARVALETSLGVAEADRMLGELAKNGHVEVRAREGRLGYALWDRDRRKLAS